VTDRVHTRIPERLLRPMFAYRQRQLADDLTAHRRASLLHAAPTTVAITGSSGLVGTALCALLTTGGHRVIRLVRREPSTGDERRWNPLDPHPDLLDGVDALIHLAGKRSRDASTPDTRQPFATAASRRPIDLPGSWPEAADPDRRL